MYGFESIIIIVSYRFIHYSHDISHVMIHDSFVSIINHNETFNNRHVFNENGATFRWLDMNYTKGKTNESVFNIKNNSDKTVQNIRL